MVILATGFDRADAIASLLIAALLLHASYGLLKASGRVFMEAAPAGLDPEEIGRVLAAQPGVVEVHDLHVWEVTSGFPALSAHVVVRAGDDCHALPAPAPAACSTTASGSTTPRCRSTTRRRRSRRCRSRCRHGDPVGRAVDSPADEGGQARTRS